MTGWVKWTATEYGVRSMIRAPIQSDEELRQAGFVPAGGIEDDAQKEAEKARFRTEFGGKRKKIEKQRHRLR